jgi:disulfide bond formation protein DsbB
MLPAARPTNLLIFLACLGALLIAFYLEYFMYMEPCPLCMTQRIFVALVGALALLAFVHNPAQSGRRVYAWLGVLLALGGGYFSSRQLWLQNLPPELVPACGPNLAFMFEAWPFMDTVRAMLHGDGNCAEIDRLFGINLVVLTLLLFIALGVGNLFQALRRR